MNFQLTSALMAQQEFHRGAEQYGILGTFMAIGSLAGALLAARRTTRRRPGTWSVAALDFGRLEIVSGLMPTYGGVCGVAAGARAGRAAHAHRVQRVGPDGCTGSALRGRVMALYVMVLMGGTPVGAPVIGWIGQTFGPRWTLIGGGALTMLGVLAVAAWLLPKITPPAGRADRRAGHVLIRPHPSRARAQRHAGVGVATQQFPSGVAVLCAQFQACEGSQRAGCRDSSPNACRSLPSSSSDRFV